MKIEMKHLAGFLPYGLKIQSVPNDGIITMNCDTCQQVVNNWFKPILRPLSDLTKEIEVNGEKFVPIVRMLESSMVVVYGDNGARVDEDCWFGFDEDIFGLKAKCCDDEIGFTIDFNTDNAGFKWSVNGDAMKINQFFLFERLLEWHFDIYGLIEQGLAIDINTLNENKITL